MITGYEPSSVRTAKTLSARTLNKTTMELLSVVTPRPARNRSGFSFPGLEVGGLQTGTVRRRRGDVLGEIHTFSKRGDNSTACNQFRKPRERRLGGLFCGGKDFGPIHRAPTPARPSLEGV